MGAKGLMRLGYCDIVCFAGEVPSLIISAPYAAVIFTQFGKNDKKEHKPYPVYNGFNVNIAPPRFLYSWLKILL